MSRPASNGITGKPSGVKKRKADDELRSEQRLAKRFDLLNLEQQTGKLYLPVQHPPPPPPARRPPANTNGTTNNDNNDNNNNGGDSMALDDTKHKLYIHNLDAELADTEPDEGERLVFLPDIEKKLGRIPHSVLLGEGQPDPGAGTGGGEMVLYRVPASLSVPEERDQVRRAIVESRARARERLVRGAGAEAAAGAAAGAVGCGDWDGDGDGDGREEEGKWKGEGEGESGAAADQVAGGGEDEDAMDLG